MQVEIVVGVTEFSGVPAYIPKLDRIDIRIRSHLQRNGRITNVDLAAMIARKIAPALAAGCTVVAKPAEDTPLTALALVKLAEEAGLPAGVLNIVTASRAHVEEVVTTWLTDSRVRKITFTGSTAVGKSLARDSAETLKKLSLELGGNAPFIVFEDADLDAAVHGLMVAKFRNGGQTCVSPNRIYVHDAVYEQFAQKLVARVEALRVGPAERNDSQIGPMINGRAVEKIEQHVQDALERGAKLLTGGRRLKNKIADGPHYFAGYGREGSRYGLDDYMQTKYLCQGGIV